MVSNLNSGVVLALTAWFDPLQPLDNWLDVTSHLALKRRGATVVYCSIYWMSARQDGLGICALCNEIRKILFPNKYLTQLWVCAVQNGLSIFCSKNVMLFYAILNKEKMSHMILPRARLINFPLLGCGCKVSRHSRDLIWSKLQLNWIKSFFLVFLFILYY